MIQLGTRAKFQIWKGELNLYCRALTLWKVHDSFWLEIHNNDMERWLRSVVSKWKFWKKYRTVKIHDDRLVIFKAKLVQMDRGGYMNFRIKEPCHVNH